LALPKQIGFSVSTSDRSKWTPPRPPEGYRDLAMPKQPSLVVRLENPPSSYGGSSAALSSAVALDRDNPMRIRIEENFRRRAFDASPSELYPEISRSLSARLTLWAEALVSTMADEAIQQAARSREEAGEYPA